MGELEGSKIEHCTYEAKSTCEETVHRYDDRAVAGSMVKIKDAKTGTCTYKIITTIQTPNARDLGETNFTVTEKFTYAENQT